MSLNYSFWKGKRVLITGHTGFKGSWISYWLHMLQAEVKGYALKPDVYPNLFEILSMDEKIDSSFGDICDLKLLDHETKKFDPEIIIHLAAQSIVRDSYKEPLNTFQTNIIGTANILEVARGLKNLKTLISVTSDKCYENNEWHWKYRESDSLGGWDPYSASKGCAEIVSASYRRSFFNGKSNNVGIATVRAGNVIGGGDWSEGRLIPDIVTAFSEGEKVTIRNPGAIRPWQFVLDLLYGYLKLAENLYYDAPKYSESWNFGPSADGENNVEYIVKKLIKYWGRNASWELDKNENPHEANYLMLDSSKVRRAIGWSPKLSLDESLKFTSDWYRNYYDGTDMRTYTEKQIRDYEKLL